jgi:hypothetical protein
MIRPLEEPVRRVQASFSPPLPWLLPGCYELDGTTPEAWEQSGTLSKSVPKYRAARSARFRHQTPALGHSELRATCGLKGPITIPFCQPSPGPGCWLLHGNRTGPDQVDADSVKIASGTVNMIGRLHDRPRSACLKEWGRVNRFRWRGSSGGACWSPRGPECRCAAETVGSKWSAAAQRGRTLMPPSNGAESVKSSWQYSGAVGFAPRSASSEMVRVAGGVCVLTRPSIPSPRNHGLLLDST